MPMLFARLASNWKDLELVKCSIHSLDVGNEARLCTVYLQATVDVKIFTERNPLSAQCQYSVS